MRTLLISAGLIFALTAVPASAAPLTVAEIADGVYVHIGKHKDFDEHYDGDIANIGFVVGADSVAIIDTGGSFKVGAELREAVRAVTKLPIRYVINTHIHPDHIFGNAAFAKDQPVFIGHSNLPATLEASREGMMRALHQALGAGADQSEIIMPTMMVQDVMDVDLGGRVLHLKAWPKAHTHTDLTVMDGKAGVFWTGDLLFIERTPSLDGDLQGWINAIEALKSVQANVTIPGHGDPTKDKNSMLNKQHAYLSLLLSDVRSAIKNGVGLMQTIDLAGQNESGNWVLFEPVNRRNVNLAYPQLEWE